MEEGQSHQVDVVSVSPSADAFISTNSPPTPSSPPPASLTPSYDDYASMTPEHSPGTRGYAMYSDAHQKANEQCDHQQRVYHQINRARQVVTTYWYSMMLCLRYMMNDETIDRDQLPVRAQQFVKWYKRQGARTAAMLVAALVIFSTIIIVFFLLSFFVAAFGSTGNNLKDAFNPDVHKFDPNQITVKRFNDPRDIDHTFLCECTPVLLRRRVPTRMIPVFDSINDGTAMSAEDAGSSDDLDFDDRPSAVVPYSNVFWVNEHLLRTYHSDIDGEEAFIVPKMWNLSASAADAAFVAGHKEFNPCVLTIRNGMTAIHMINPIIIREPESHTVNEQEGTQKNLLLVRHSPSVFAPFLMERNETAPGEEPEVELDRIESYIKRHFMLRYYEYPDMNRRVLELNPDTVSPEFQVQIQFAMQALRDGFAKAIASHGPFPILERRLERERQEVRRLKRAQKAPLPYEDETIPDFDDADIHTNPLRAPDTSFTPPKDDAEGEMEEIDLVPIMIDGRETWVDRRYAKRFMKSAQL